VPICLDDIIGIAGRFRRNTQAELGRVRLLVSQDDLAPVYLTYETEAGRFLVEIPEAYGPREETVKATLIELLETSRYGAAVG
jgi:hypothetical protein